MTITRTLLRRSTALRRVPPSSRTLLTSAAPSTSTTSNASPAAPPAPPATPKPRLAALRASLAASPSPHLTDTFHRTHTYLRISLTERCNLRCLYCMPSSGIPLSPPVTQLSTPEILELSHLFITSGITKIRLTGGEPTVRPDFLEIIERLGEMRSLGLKEIAMTTNGVLLGGRRGREVMRRAVEAGLNRLNVSLDTRVGAKFEFMTRRKGVERVVEGVRRAVEEFGFGLGDGEDRLIKVNVVVMRGVNDDEVLDFVEWVREMPVEVRFIEYMPFDGNKWSTGKMMPWTEIHSLILSAHPALAPLPNSHPNDTAKTYHIPGYAGRIGFITSMTENFCGSCNRLRITGDGNIKVCLFGNEEVSLRDVMREYRGAEVGFREGERREEMRERLLETVGWAVKRKEEGHKDPSVLVKETGRPMILIDELLGARRTYSSKKHATHRSSPLGPHIPLHLLTTGPYASSMGSVRAYSSYSFFESISKIYRPTPDTTAPINPNTTLDTTPQLGTIPVSETASNSTSTSALSSVSSSSPSPSVSSLTSEFTSSTLSGTITVPETTSTFTSLLDEHSSPSPAPSSSSPEPSITEGPEPELSTIKDPELQPEPLSRPRITRHRAASKRLPRRIPEQPRLTPSRRQPASLAPSPIAIPSSHIPTPQPTTTTTPPPPERLTHLDTSGRAFMVSVSSKPITTRSATAIAHVIFTSPHVVPLLLASHSHQSPSSTTESAPTPTPGSLSKGDALTVSRIAAITATKKTPELVTLCHPIEVTGVQAQVEVTGPMRASVLVTVETVGRTGVEMEALVGALGGAVNLVDMVKGVDRGVRVEGGRCVRKEGGRSGGWMEEGWEFMEEEAGEGEEVEGNGVRRLVDENGRLVAWRGEGEGGEEEGNKGGLVIRKLWKGESPSRREGAPMTVGANGNVWGEVQK